MCECEAIVRRKISQIDDELVEWDERLGEIERGEFPAVDVLTYDDVKYFTESKVRQIKYMREAFRIVLMEIVSAKGD